MSRIFSLISRRVALFSAFVALLLSVSALANAEDPKFQQISDIVYKTVGDRQIKLNLFLPVKDGQTLKGEPLLICLDSGCWYSDAPGNGGLWRMFGAIERGFAVASVSHRSVEETPFPAQMEDVRAAVRFLRKHASEYGYDPERFAVAGGSSGGHLSMTLGVSDAKTPYNVGDNLDVSGQVQRVVDFYGPADLSFVFDRYADHALDCVYKAFGVSRENAKKTNAEKYAQLQEQARKHSPIFYVDADYAPTIIIQGADDPIVSLSQSALFYDALRMNRVRAKIFVVNGGVHSIKTMGEPEALAREIFEFLEW